MLLHFVNGLFSIGLILIVIEICSLAQASKCRPDQGAAATQSPSPIPLYVSDCVRLNYEATPGSTPSPRTKPERRVKRQQPASAQEPSRRVSPDDADLQSFLEDEDFLVHLGRDQHPRPTSVFTQGGGDGWNYRNLKPFERISLSAFDREFELLLMSQYKEMAPDIQILTVSAHQNESSLDARTHLRTLYKGIVKGDAYSHVEGSVIDGVFEGKISLSAATSLPYTTTTSNASVSSSSCSVYYVERIYAGDQVDFHSIIYSEDHLRDRYTTGREKTQSQATPQPPTQNSVRPERPYSRGNDEGQLYGDVHIHDSWCGLSDEKNLRWMMSHYQNLPEHISPRHNKKPVKRKGPEEKVSTPKSTKEDMGISRDALREHTRAKRSVPVKNTCSIFIQTDPFLWNHISKKLGTKDKSRIREEIIVMISSHINAVNHIYGSTEFGDIKGIQFVVQRIKILEDTYCDNIVSQKQGSYCNANLDVSNVLNLWSLENHDDFCLAYLWTYRDFIGGTLGLAWVAASEREAGGLCESYKPYSEFVQNKRLTTFKSLNTGIITLVNYGSPVSPRVTHLTFAHEIGHNLGSPHDYPTLCRPGQAFSDPSGNYIMFSSATSGDRLNNDKFSRCSKKNVSQILDAILNEKYGKVNCLIKSDGAFCGNGLKESGEECDCGYPEECQANGEIMCCNPRTEDLTTSCKKKPGVKCSPSEGQCCTKQCKHVTPDTICAQETECSYRSYCSGQSAQCPSPRFKANRTTACNDNTQVCWSGQCGGSICQKVNLEQCFKTAPKDDKNYDRGKLCELACQMPNQPETCKSSYDYPALRNINRGKGINLKPGSPCNNFQGYCDVLLKCREVDTEGPLTRLKNLIFNIKTFSLLKYWIKVHWWAISLIAFSMMFFMGIFIKCCAVHTPSSNPKKPPARSFSDTMSRTANTIRRTGHQMVHTAYTLRRNASNAQYHHSSSSFAIEPRAQTTQAQQPASRKKRSQSAQAPYTNGNFVSPFPPPSNGGSREKSKNGKSAVRDAKNGISNGNNKISSSNGQNSDGGHHYKKSNYRKNGRHKMTSGSENNHRSSSSQHSTKSNGHQPGTESHAQHYLPYPNGSSTNQHHNLPAVLHHPGPHYVGAHYGNNHNSDLVLRERDLFTKGSNHRAPSATKSTGPLEKGEKDKSKKRKKKGEMDKKKCRKEHEKSDGSSSNNYQRQVAEVLAGSPPTLNMNIADPGQSHNAHEQSYLPYTNASQPTSSAAAPPNLTIASYDQPPPPYTPSAPPGETSFSFAKSSNLPRGGYGKNRGLYNQVKKDSSSSSAVSNKKKRKS